MHDSPMFVNTCRTFEREAPDNNTEKQSKKFPTGILVPLI